jgi:hypothetical protein
MKPTVASSHPLRDKTSASPVCSFAEGRYVFEENGENEHNYFQLL